AWLAGGDVEVRGRIGQALRAAGGAIRLDARIDGDVDLIGGEIEIGPATEIGGRLVYRSPGPARIDPAARIAGGVTHLRPPPSGPPAAIASTVLRVIGLVAFLALVVTGLVLLLLFPGFFAASARTVATDPWKTLGLGLAALVATPALALALMLTVLGVPLALVLLAAYGVALLVGFLVGAVFLGDAGARLLGRGREPSRGARVAGFLVALLLLGLAGAVHLAGGLLLFLVLLFGLGALALERYRAYAG
ncbi:MAG: hypothetical protein ACREMB_04040, partial [Candidatus Rokuibacteriota bacterium]